MPPIYRSWYTFRQLLKWQNISKVYGRRRLFDKLSGEVASGGGMVVTGANGAGKSTLLKVFAGIVRPDTGTVERGCEQLEIGFAAPDQLFYTEFTALENLAFVTEVRGIDLNPETMMASLDSVGLAKSANKAVGAFSTGMVQRLRIASALSIGSHLILCDEPTIGLDSAGVELVESLLVSTSQNGGKNPAIILATNEPNQAKRFIDLGWETIHVGA